MPFQMKVQPLDSKGSTAKNDPVKPVAKSRLKRLFERQFPKLSGAGEGKEREKDDGELEPSSVCLDRMVLSFIEESNDRSSRCSRSRCNCFNGNCDDSSDDEFDFRAADAPPISAAPPGDASELLKGLVPCASIAERNLLADASKIVEANKIGKGKDDCRRIVMENLRSLGYDASICKSRWEKTPSCPAGEYEYVDVMIEGERFLIDVDFRSEFEIARSTKNYRAVLQSLPSIFVGKADRLQLIVAVVSEAARQSLKKKGLHFPPWRKLEYMKAKWLSPYERTSNAVNTDVSEKNTATTPTPGSGQSKSAPCAISAVNFNGEFEMRGVVLESEKITVVVSQWKPPAVKPKPSLNGAKVVTGLASVLTEKPLQPPTKF